jgi:hypothetical protein
VRLRHHTSAIPIAAIASLAISSAAAAQAGQEAEERGTETIAGITVTAEADAWRGVPADLTRVIPLLVTIENNGARPLRLRYTEFALVDETKHSSALPPFRIEGTETVGTSAAFGEYPYPWSGFYVAPYLSRYYPGLTPFAGPFVYDPFFYTSYYPRFVQLQLPTGDMVQKALPEGVLEPGGRMSGFLYFEDVDIGDVNGDDDMGRFLMDLVDASTTRALGTIAIPLEID